MSINNEEKTVKLVTQWNISAIPYNEGNNSAFEESYMEDWLNDTSVDGFLGNLREPEKFIVMDAAWDTTIDDNALGSIERPNGTTTVTDAVGLLNIYEYQTSYIGSDYSNGYLNNGLPWWTLTSSSVQNIRFVHSSGNTSFLNSANTNGIRPSVNLKLNIQIVDGDGTIDNPYRLNGDNDQNLEGTFLNKRYSGEYIRFGNGENNLYRIVSHENGMGTKITSTEPLKDFGTFKTMSFGDTISFSSENTIGAFLNNEYLNTGNGYLTSNDIAMIEDTTTWYLGTVGNGTSYKLAKYTDTNMSSTNSSNIEVKVGLLRLGELMAGNFDISVSNVSYWTLTPYSANYVCRIGSGRGDSIFDTSTNINGIRPSMNLKSNVVITSGEGTLQNPFEIALQ